MGPGNLEARAVSNAAVRSALVLAVALLAPACAPSDLPASLDPQPEMQREAGRSTTELENLRAFAHLYGYVRFFHPTDAAAEAHWPTLAATGVATARGARSVGELADRLEQFYRPYAPSMQVWTDQEPEPPDPPPVRRRAELVYWQYQGFPGTPLHLFVPPYRQVRVGSSERAFRTFTEAPAPDARVEADLVDELHLRLPVTLHREVAAQAVPTDEPLQPVSEQDLRDAAVIEVWNVLRHFYPYRDAVAEDWDAILEHALLDAADDVTIGDTVVTLRRLVHRIRDGHAEVGHQQQPRRGSLPFRLELVQDRAVITGTSQREPFEVGDVVLGIDGKPVLEAVQRLQDEVSGSPQWRRFKAATLEVSAGPLDQPVQVELERDGKVMRITTRFHDEAPPKPERPEPIHRFEDGVYYVDLTRGDWSDIQAALPEIATAPGVVFDMRGYPNETHRVLEHLLSDPEDALWMHVPRFVEPGGEAVGWKDLGWHLRPAQPHIDGEVAFLVSAEAISYAESLLGYVEAHGLGTVIGSTPTAGTNGDIVRFDTVGGYYVIFTGMRVTHHDGRAFHLRGITPDTVVTPSIEGIRQGRDEQLEHARSLLAAR